MVDYRLGLYEKALPDELTWEDKLLAAHEAGYDFLEMSIDESDFRIERIYWSDDAIKKLHEVMLDTGIRIESICFSAQRKFPLGSGLPGAAEKALDLLHRAIVLALKMGVRIIQIQGYDCFYNEESGFSTKERFFRNLRMGSLIAARYGIILGIETMENDFINTVEKAMYYVKEINSPYITVYPDVGNISNATQDVCKDLRYGKGHISAAHIKETVPGKFRNIDYGTGQVDFPSIIKTLLDQDVRRFTAEFWYKKEYDWKAIIKSNRAFLENQFSIANSYL